jgi:hypothetical protein
MTKTPPADPPRRRNPAALAADIIAGVAIALFGLLLGLVVLASATQYSHLNDGICVDGPYSGLTCNANALTIAVGLISAVTIFAWALTTGMFVVRLLRKRLAFYWPIIGIVVMLVGFWIGTYFVGQIAELSS